MRGLLLRVVLHADFFELAVPKVAREATRRRMNVSVLRLSQLLEKLAECLPLTVQSVYKIHQSTQTTKVRCYTEVGR